MSASGDASMVTIFIVISVLILLIACVNFINIAIARSVKRSREVGMRKVLGAGRGSLIIQFISESVIITFASLIIALGIVELVLPELNKLLGTTFRIEFFSNPLFNVGLLLLFIVISLASGYYPAFYLSRLQPIAVLKRRFIGFRKKNRFSEQSSGCFSVCHFNWIDSCRSGYS
jgi:putative ABC transport system permease protein